MSVLGDITAPNVNFTSQLFGDNPDVAYQAWLKQIGRGGVDPLSQFYQQQYQRQYRGYLADLPNHPVGYSFTDALQGQQAPLMQQYQQQAPRERGLNYGNYLGQVRYLL